MAEIVKGKIGNALTSTAADHVVAVADDIFDEELKSYQSVLNNLTVIKDENGEIQENPFRYIANEEFIFAVVDNAGTFLCGIHWDGTPQFAKLEATTSNELKLINGHIKILSDKISTIVGDNDLTDIIDTFNEMKQFFTDITNTEKLTSILKLIDKIAIHDENGEVQESPFSIISNDEFVKAVVDADGKLLFGIRTDGKPYFPKNEMYNVIQNDEFLYAVVDVENKLLVGIRHDGEIIEGKIPLKTRQEIEHVKTELSRNVLAVEMDRGTGRIIGHTGNDSRIKSCVQDRVTGIITINQVIE